MTKRQSWVYQQMGFLITHVRRNGASRSSGGFRPVQTPASRTNRIDPLLIQNSVLRESRSQPMFTSTPVSTDSKILEHFDQMRTLISGFLQQKLDRQPFFDYGASEAKKMTQEEFEDLKGRILETLKPLRATVAVNHYLEDQPLLPRSPRGSGYCQQPLNRCLVPPKQQLAAVMSITHPAP